LAQDVSDVLVPFVPSASTVRRVAGGPVVG